MTTDAAPRERDISELMKLDSYQDMTDTEISKVIEYREKVARLEATKQVLEQREADTRAAFDTVISDMRASTQAAFKAAVEYTPDFKEVNANG